MTIRDLTILGCSSQQPTRLRNHGAYFVRWNGEGFLFDPGEGTQRQFIFANIAPTAVSRIFLSHFHGDHCLGFGSMLMRLNLDKVEHEIHCYYPASGKVYFDRLRYGTAYHDRLHVIEHPVSENGIVHDDGCFRIEARFLEHSIDNLGWRIQEADSLKFDKRKLKEAGVEGARVRELQEQGKLVIGDKIITLDQVSSHREGDVFSCVIDTNYCDSAVYLAKGARMLLCESTYLEEHKELAREHYHLTARQAAQIAKEAGAQELILTHFSARYRNLLAFEEEAKTIFQNTHVADDFKCFPFPR